MKIKRLGDILVDSGVLTEEKLAEALAIQKDSKMRLGELLIQEGFITESELIDSLRMQLGIDFVDLSTAKIDPTLLTLIPKNVAKQYGVVPVKMKGDQLYVAMIDPLNFRAIEQLKDITRKKIVPLISYQEAINRTINILYENEGAASAIKEMRDGGEFDYTEASPEDFENDSAPTIKLVNSIIDRGIAEKASDLHIEPYEFETVVRIRVDGKLVEVLRFPKNFHTAVISRLKVMGGMNTTERRVPQDGRAEIKKPDIGKVDLRINTLPSIHGEKCVIRYLRRDTSELTRKGIGITEKDNERFDRIVRNSSGLILVVGPTGSGKTSTLYTILGEVNKPDVNIISLEDPVEFQIDGVTQVAINEKVGMTFAEALRACLRQDPDIICVGEIRDGETAEIAMRAAMTGHLVLSTLHTEDAVSAIDRLKDMGVEPYLISGSLRGVISQRLVRVICQDCKEEVPPDLYACDLIGIKDVTGKHFYKGKGCHKCFNSGYRGRTGVFELLTLDSRTRDGINQNLTSVELRKLFKEGAYTTMLENAIQLIEKGVTTVDEVLSKIATIE